MARRTRFLAIAAVLTLVLFVLFPHYKHAWTPTPITSKPDGETTETGPLPGSPVNMNQAEDLGTTSDSYGKLCEENNCFRGSWKQREPPLVNLEDVKPWTGCPAASKTGGSETDVEQGKSSASRLLDIVNWKWEPTHSSLEEWNPEAFVVRLLKSPGGLVFLGDENTRDHFTALLGNLNHSRISFDVDLNTPLRFKTQHVQQYTLSPSDPSTERLRLAADVPVSRLERPILTLIQDSLLVNEAELQTISQRVGKAEDHGWTRELPSVHGWPSLVEDLAATRNEERETVTEDTIVIINTGIHWSRHQLTLLKARNNPADEQAYLTEAYRQMVRVVSEQLKVNPRVFIYYRATTPGHPKCYIHSSPYKTPGAAQALEKNVVSRLLQGVATEAERQQKRKWDWDLFPVHNEVWRRAIIRLEHERKMLFAKPFPLQRLYAKWHYLDIWSQALQRPDAHYDPSQDCLRWCSPVLFDQWTRHLHHILQMKHREAAHRLRTDDLFN
ncbi:hypothetical protein FA15DRAFT_327405 [Coprinopsis marcescibilis]|uniref:Uncharacterized protein n=1 Tax=Coprinopsis marcescibilis TaxID=230819 RepID=A0A5C3KZX8_COPMA|nr:hypothetical protein FA15DRAFT_327405 [Coprinopsis marcescibilis]